MCRQLLSEAPHVRMSTNYSPAAGAESSALDDEEPAKPRQADVTCCIACAPEPHWHQPECISTSPRSTTTAGNHAFIFFYSSASLTASRVGPADCPLLANERSTTRSMHRLMSPSAAGRMPGHPSTLGVATPHSKPVFSCCAYRTALCTRMGACHVGETASRYQAAGGMQTIMNGF